jgi:hypothetical protein
MRRGTGSGHVEGIVWTEVTGRQRRITWCRNAFIAQHDDAEVGTAVRSLVRLSTIHTGLTRGYALTICISVFVVHFTRILHVIAMR